MSEYGLFVASAFVSAVTRLAGALRGRRPERAPRRILVVKVDHLGDVITAEPALRALRESHPDAVIDLVLAPAVAPLFQGSALVTRVLAYESPRFRRAPATLEDEQNALAALRAIAAPGYDTIVELRGDQATLLLPLYARARRRFDRGTVRIRDRMRRWIPIARRPPLHEVETNCAVVRPLVKREVPPYAPRIRVAEPARDGMRRALHDAAVDPAAPYVCLHPGAAWRPRAWRPERFAAIADWVAAHYDAQVVFVGSAAERDIEAKLRERVRAPRAAFLFGTLSLPELAALLESARLLIGNDSGLAHLAAACGTPTVALFGAQDPRRFRPWSTKAATLHHPVHCFPCAQVRCVHPEHPCVNLIEVSEVERAVRELLGAPPTPAPLSAVPLR